MKRRLATLVAVLASSDEREALHFRTANPPTAFVEHGQQHGGEDDQAKDQVLLASADASLVQAALYDRDDQSPDKRSKFLFIMPPLSQSVRVRRIA